MMACWRCIRGAVVRDLAGEAQCLNCGAPAQRPAASPAPGRGTTSPGKRRGPRCRWERDEAA